MKKNWKVAIMALGDKGWQGGIQYSINILNALNAIGKEHNIEVHLFKKANQEFHELDRFKDIRLVYHDADTVLPPFNLQNRVKWLVDRKMKGLINPRLEHFLVGLGIDFVYPAILSNSGGKLKSAGWIADFQYSHFPDGARKEFNVEAERFVKYIVANASRIVLSSAFCERDCLRLFPETKGKTDVLPFSVAISESDLEADNFLQVLDQYELPAKYIMVANLFAPTKNHKTLFEALGMLKQKGIVIPLVCTGNIVDYRNEHFGNEILQQLNQNRVRNQVFLLGLIPRKDQMIIMRAAAAVVQPSLNEGWNTSVEEAKCLGKTLLLSDIEVHREQAAATATLFTPLNAVELAGVLENMWATAETTTFPEKEKEAIAYRQYQQNVKAFGEQFLRLAEH